MAATMNKTAVVTGVSTGIGRAIASSLIDDGWRVFGSVRKEADAADAKAALGDRFTPLLFDVTQEKDITAAADQVREALAGETLGALINNAGVAVGGPLAYLPMDEVKRQFDINVLGVVRVTQAFLPLLGTDKTLKGAPGRVINMSSVAGKIASPILAPYAMSKHALEAFSDGLRRELNVHGIDVITIGPGAIKTPIWDKSDEIDAEQYASTEYYAIMSDMRTRLKEYGQTGLEPAEVGDLTRDILNHPKPKTRYPIMRGKFLNWTLARLLPARWLDRIITDRFNLKPPTA